MLAILVILSTESAWEEENREYKAENTEYKGHQEEWEENDGF